MKQAMTVILGSLRRNLDILALILVLQFWPSLTNTPLNLRGALTLAGLCVVYRLIAAAEQLEKTETPPVEEKKEFVDDPELVLELTKRSGFDAIRRLNPYLGKWITVSGRFEGIAESLQKDAVHLSLLLNDGRRINLRFAMEHWDRLQALREGQRITAAGRIPCYDLVFSPENCELIRVERLRLAYAS